MPGHGREIVVLVVVPDVEGQPVHAAVVAEGLLRVLVFGHHVMPLDPAGTEGMKAGGEEHRGEEIEQGGPPEGHHDQHVRPEDDDPVEENPAVESLDLFDSHRVNRRKDREQREPERLPDRRIADEPRLPLARNVGVQLVHALIGVVLQVVPLEGDGGRKRARDVGQTARQRVEDPLLEDEVVAALVDLHEQGVVRDGSHRVGDEEKDPPRLADDPGGCGDLKSYEGDDRQKAVRVSPDELANVGVLTENGLRSGLVGLCLWGIRKTFRHGGQDTHPFNPVNALFWSG